MNVTIDLMNPEERAKLSMILEIFEGKPVKVEAPKVEQPDPVVEAPVQPEVQAPVAPPVEEPKVEKPVPTTPPADEPACPITDAASLTKYTMESYQALGPEKGGQIQAILAELGVNNINAVPAASYPVFYQKVEALKA